MWKLKFSSQGETACQWLRTVNNHCGREVWEFDPDDGSEEEREAVELARKNFTGNRFEKKRSSDLIMRMQFAKENPCHQLLPRVSVGEKVDVTAEAVTVTVRRALRFYSTIQAHDGHWTGDTGGSMFLMPGMVIALYITGALHTVLSPIHIKEMCRYLYNHQFSTTMNYVTLRLLGERTDGSTLGPLETARKWILDHGGAAGVAPWGKLWLAVVKEIIRFNGSLMLRQSVQDVSAKGYTIPKGWAVLVYPASAHTDPHSFPDPLCFNPSRWEDPNVGRHDFIPFGGGVRLCVGRDFSKLFITIFLHHLVTKYRWKTIKGGEITRKPHVAFPNGFHVQLLQRKVMTPDSNRGG